MGKYVAYKVFKFQSVEKKDCNKTKLISLDKSLPPAPAAGSSWPSFVPVLPAFSQTVILDFPEEPNQGTKFTETQDTNATKVTNSLPAAQR